MSKNNQLEGNPSNISQHFPLPSQHSFKFHQDSSPASSQQNSNSATVFSSFLHKVSMKHQADASRMTTVWPQLCISLITTGSQIQKAPQKTCSLPKSFIASQGYTGGCVCDSDPLRSTWLIVYVGVLKNAG